jgi:hypothetical protein
MDFKFLQSQMELAKKSISEIKNQNTIFETLLHEAIKGAPEEDKQEIERVRALSVKALNLAKAGKTKEAQDLIKNFRHGGQSNK